MNKRVPRILPAVQTNSNCLGSSVLPIDKKKIVVLCTHIPISYISLLSFFNPYNWRARAPLIDPGSYYR
ncbi:unnamed protein product, partial [Linum tenue]